jgi:cob(I)alamin adenosyltransferase
MGASPRFVQIYTGNGKGKTTAAIGQAIRGAGAGLRTLVIAFMKEYPYGEFEALKRFADLITVEAYGGDAFVYRKQPPGEEDLAVARRALDRAREALASGRYDSIVLDEVCVAAYFGLVQPEDLFPLFDARPPGVELVLTGRYCPPAWIDRADLVTEMHEVKHYYTQGVLARKGFES